MIKVINNHIRKSLFIQQKNILINYNLVFTDIIIKLKNNLINVDFTIDNLGPMLKEFSKSNNIIYSNFMKSLRNIISGLKVCKFTI